MGQSVFDQECRRCSRLAGFLDEVGQEYPHYHARPVPAFGDPSANLLIVGLAPGMHGANATGRPFTGDHAGILLYQTIYETGFSSKPESVSADDDLKLINCRITNAVKCLPPQNKPTGDEVKICNSFLMTELQSLDKGGVIIALGAIAHRAVIMAYGLKQSDYKFGHGAMHDLPAVTLIDSYHCSRYNTQTRRLTEQMFKDVFNQARSCLDV